MGWYLDAVLGRDRHDPPQVWLLLEDERPAITVHRFTDLLEETLVQAPRRLGYQQPPDALTNVLVGVQRALGYVEEGARVRPEGHRAVKELEFALKHIETLVLAVLDMRWWPAPR